MLVFIQQICNLKYCFIATATHPTNPPPAYALAPPPPYIYEPPTTTTKWTENETLKNNIQYKDQQDRPVSSGSGSKFNKHQLKATSIKKIKIRPTGSSPCGFLSAVICGIFSAYQLRQLRNKNQTNCCMSMYASLSCYIWYFLFNKFNKTNMWSLPSHSTVHSICHDDYNLNTLLLSIYNNHVFSFSSTIKYVYSTVRLMLCDNISMATVCVYRLHVYIASYRHVITSESNDRGQTSYLNN